MTDTQSLRFGQVTDVITHTMQQNLADDIAAQLDLADTARTAALKRPIARVQRGTALAIPVTTVTVVPWVTELTDTHAMVDIATQPTRITAGATAGTGAYIVQADLQGSYTGWTRADLLIYKNGAVYAQRTWFTPQDFNILAITTMVNFGVVGDFVDLRIYHEGGGSTNTLTVNMNATKISN